MSVLTLPLFLLAFILLGPLLFGSIRKGHEAMMGLFP